MTRVSEGDDAAFAELFDRYEKRLTGFIGRMLRDREAARDLLQETFLRLHQHRSRYRAGEPFASWVFRIARNACASELKRARRRAVLPGERSDARTPGAPAAAATEATGPLEKAEREEAARRVEAATASLPVEEREVVLLKIYHDLPFREIARITRTPEATVRLRFNRGLAKLRRSAGG